jgi:hypothetical protein
MWEPRRLTTPWASTACYRDSFTFIFTPILEVKIILHNHAYHLTDFDEKLYAVLPL